jgi:hypothetical protein
MDIETTNISNTAPPAAAPRARVALSEIKKQEEFETKEGVWAPIHMMGLYAGELLLTYIANEELMKKYRAECEKLRVKLCKPKGWKPEDGSDESETCWRHAMIGTCVHDFRDWEAEPGVALPHPASEKEIHGVLHDLFSNFRTVRSGVNNFITEQENFNLRKLETLKGES